MVRSIPGRSDARRRYGARSRRRDNVIGFLTVERGRRREDSLSVDTENSPTDSSARRGRRTHCRYHPGDGRLPPAASGSGELAVGRQERPTRPHQSGTEVSRRRCRTRRPSVRTSRRSRMRNAPRPAQRSVARCLATGRPFEARLRRTGSSPWFGHQRREGAADRLVVCLWGRSREPCSRSRCDRTPLSCGGGHGSGCRMKLSAVPPVTVVRNTHSRHQVRIRLRLYHPRDA